MQPFVSWVISSKDTQSQRTEHYVCARPSARGPTQRYFSRVGSLLAWGVRSRLCVHTWFSFNARSTYPYNICAWGGKCSKQTLPRSTALYAYAQSWARGPNPLVGNLKPGPASKRVSCNRWDRRPITDRFTQNFHRGTLQSDVVFLFPRKVRRRLPQHRRSSAPAWRKRASRARGAGVSRIEYEGKYVGKLSPYTYIIRSLYYLHALQEKVGMH